MRVLLISTDRNVCRPESAVSLRMQSYARQWGKAEVIVFSTRAHWCEEIPLSEDVYIHPTHSWHKLLYAFDALRIARRIAKPDVISVQDPFETGLTALVIAWFLKVPLHVQVHTDFTAPEYVKHSWLNRARAVLARFVLQYACGVRVILTRTKDALIARKIKAPIAVLPIFVDITKYREGTRSRHPKFDINLVVVGRIEPEKRFDRALEALKVVRDAGHNAGLTIVGSGSLQPDLVQRARDLGIESHVDFVGWKDDTIPYLAQADAVLVPSEYEGYGMVIVESLAAGVPVIATDVGVAREAGAIVASPDTFSAAVLEWVEQGNRTGMLQNYPYRDNHDYIQKVTYDIAQCATRT